MTSLGHSHLLDLAEGRLVLDKEADNPRQAARDNDGDQALGNGPDVGVYDGPAHVLGQLVDGHGTLADEGDIDARIGRGELAIQEDRLDRVDDADAEGGAGELGERDDAVGLGNEVRAVMVLGYRSVLFATQRAVDVLWMAKRGFWNEMPMPTPARIWKPINRGLGVCASTACQKDTSSDTAVTYWCRASQSQQR